MVEKGVCVSVVKRHTSCIQLSQYASRRAYETVTNAPGSGGNLHYLIIVLSVPYKLPYTVPSVDHLYMSSRYTVSCAKERQRNAEQSASKILVSLVRFGSTTAHHVLF